MINTIEQNQDIINSYQAEVSQNEHLKQQAKALLDQLSFIYPDIVNNSDKNMDAFRVKLSLTNNRDKLNEIVEKIKELIDAIKSNNISKINEIHQWLSSPLENESKVKIFTRSLNQSPFPEKYNVLNETPFKNVELFDINDIKLDEKFNINKIRNTYIMDNFNINEILSYISATDSKAKFGLSLLMKATEKLIGLGANLTVYMTTQGGKVFIDKILTPTGGVIGASILSRIPMTINGKRDSMLSHFTRITADAASNTTAAAVKGFVQGLSDST